MTIPAFAFEARHTCMAMRARAAAGRQISSSDRHTGRPAHRPKALDASKTVQVPIYM
jgi:hypothetical protein